MPETTTLEIKGTIAATPLAELIVEIRVAELSGSLRISSGSKRTILYFAAGELVYAVSNLRSFRLATILAKAGTITAATPLSGVEPGNDVELAAALVSRGVMSKTDVDEQTSKQVTSVITDSFSWPEGDWQFDPLARPRQGLAAKLAIDDILIEAARATTFDSIAERFRSVGETFKPISGRQAELIRLQAHEAVVLDTFGGRALSISELREASHLPEGAVLQALYVLWLGGWLERETWNTTFSQNALDNLRKTKISLVRGALTFVDPAPRPVTDEPTIETTPPKAAAMPELRLEQYLELVETTESLYEKLSLTNRASDADVKAAYFAMAKLFHPDRYHREEKETLKRIQTAFTEIAFAYENLKTGAAREAYDVKFGREQEFKAKRKSDGGEAGTEDRRADIGLESFEQGITMLNEEEYDAAAAYLARAVHYSPDNALYHAVYGTALAAEDTQRHKAESELLHAVRLDPQNPKIRFMLVDFFVQRNMHRRAEGELRRFLDLVPNNADALKRLEKMTA